MHPYKHQADSSRKAKAGNMGKVNNLDIPVMRAVGENSGKKLYSSSSSSQQHNGQGAADGMKRGGHVGKHRSKPKIKIAMVAPDAAVPSTDPSMAAAGAGSSPAPAPMPPPPGAPPPMANKGGRFANGGRAYPKHGGADSGLGRLDLAAIQAKKKK
jgi:hypothetical protein